MIETVCSRGHVEHVDSAREEAGRCCYRRFPDGSFCDAMIVSTFVLEEPAPDCGINGPHAPGAHPPAIDLSALDDDGDGCSLEECYPNDKDIDPADLELDEEEDDKLGRRPATIMVGLLVALGTLASLIFTVLFMLQGRWILALLV